MPADVLVDLVVAAEGRCSSGALPCTPPAASPAAATGSPSAPAPPSGPRSCEAAASPPAAGAAGLSEDTAAAASPGAASAPLAVATGGGRRPLVGPRIAGLARISSAAATMAATETRCCSCFSRGEGTYAVSVRRSCCEGGGAGRGPSAPPALWAGAAEGSCATEASAANAATLPSPSSAGGPRSKPAARGGPT